MNPFTRCSSTYGSGSSTLGAAAAAAAAIAAVTALPPDLLLLAAEASGVRLSPDSSPDRPRAAGWLLVAALAAAGAWSEPGAAAVSARGVTWRLGITEAFFLGSMGLKAEGARGTRHQQQQHHICTCVHVCFWGGGRPWATTG